MLGKIFKTKKSVVLPILEFKMPEISLITKPKGRRVKVRIFCKTCNRHHHMHWGEFKNAMSSGTINSLQNIINKYSMKYCGCDMATARTKAMQRFTQSLVTSLSTWTKEANEIIESFEKIGSEEKIDIAEKLMDP